MKNLFKYSLVLLSFLSLKAEASSVIKVWKQSNIREKVFLFNEYKAFFTQNPQELKHWEEKITRLTWLINEAWANEGMDCIYAGWPSKRIGGACSSPARMNPGYQAGSCGTGELHCQPLLFGDGLCAPARTPSERSLAFSTCDKKFSSSNRSVEDHIKKIKADGKEQEMLNLFDFAEKICTEGAQKSTGMCRRLEAAVERVRSGMPLEAKVTVVAGGDVVSDLVVNRDVVAGVTDVVTVTDVAVDSGRVPTTVCTDCGIEVVDQGVIEGDPFDRDEPRAGEFEFTTSRPGADPVVQNTFLKVQEDENLRPTGFEFRMTGPNTLAGLPLDPSEKVERNWNFVSMDNSKRDTYLWITDDAGSGYLSQLMETVIVMVPRRVKPSVVAVGNELHVTLATGEKVIYDKTTRLIKSGALSEGAVDLNPNRFNRKFAPVNYTGSGISIRTDKRGEDPRLITGNATVTQNGKTCQVPARELWNETDFKYADDAALVGFLNQKCGNKFKL